MPPVRLDSNPLTIHELIDRLTIMWHRHGDLEVYMSVSERTPLLGTRRHEAPVAGAILMQDSYIALYGAARKDKK
jgi:hypothetical protein